MVVSSLKKRRNFLKDDRMSISMSSGYISWMARTLSENDNVASVTVKENRTLQVITTKGNMYCIGGVNTRSINYHDLYEYLEDKDVDLLSIQGGVDFITGDALDLLDSKSIGFDSFGRIAASLEYDRPHEQLDKEHMFINRVFRQHQEVSAVRRETNKKYRLERYGLDDLLIVVVNDYDMTAEAVRNAIDIHGTCDIVFSSNPNGRLTSQSKEAAESMGLEIYKLKDLLIRIAKK